MHDKIMSVFDVEVIIIKQLIWNSHYETIAIKQLLFNRETNNAKFYFILI